MSRGRNKRSAPARFELLEDRRLMSAGTLDPSFGVGGKVTTGLFGQDVAVDSNNRTIVSGTLNGNFAIKRLNPNGKPDTTFGTNGLVTTDFGGLTSDLANRVVVQSDGKIVVAGLQANSGGADKPFNARFALARFNANGSPDKTFGTGGKVLVLGSQTTPGITGLNTYLGGKLVFSASIKNKGDFDFIVVRLLPNGSLDSGFNSGKGHIITGMGGDDIASAQIIQPGGKIVVGGTRLGEGTDAFILARYNHQGFLDREFSGDGKAETRMVRDARLSALAHDINGGGIVAAGTMTTADGKRSQLLLRRFNPDGLGNSQFASVLANASAISLATQPRAVFVRGTSIIVLGNEQTTAQNGNHNRVFASQFHLGGKVDSSFGSLGTALFDFGGRMFSPSAALPPNGNMVFSFQGNSISSSGVARFHQMIPRVSLVPISASASEGRPDASFRVGRSGRYDFPTRVFINLRGDATHGKDYTTSLVTPGQSRSNTTSRGGVGGSFTVGGLSGVTGVFTTADQGYVDIPAFQDNVTVTVKIIDDNVFDPIEQADFILFDNPLYGRADDAHVTSIKIFDATDTLRVNFQPQGVVPTGGYKADTGLAFGDRGSGLKFGWDADNTANARVHNNAGSPDFRYDTYNHLQKNGADRKWELAVPNGIYDVRLVAGDPTATDSLYRMNLENQLALSGTPAGDVRWFRRSFRVQVTDGRLTLGNGAGAANNKIAFLDVRLADTGKPPGPITENLPVRLLSPATLPLWHRTPSGLFADNQIDEPLWA